MDIFYEQFLSKNYTKEEKVFKALKLVLIILIFFNITLGSLILTVFMATCYLLTVIISRKIILEYEYELFQKELIISKIMNKSSRKKIACINVENITEIIDLEEFNRKDIKVINTTLSKIDKKKVETKIILVRKDSALVGYKVALDKKIQSKLKTINSNIFKNKLV